MGVLWCFAFPRRGKPWEFLTVGDLLLSEHFNRPGANNSVLDSVAVPRQSSV